MPARVMIVEDDRDVALLLRYNLEAAGYQVEHVESGDDAEERIAASMPDLVLLDWMLPGVSGIEICRRVRKWMAMDKLPIIMLTARTEKSDRDYAFRQGVNDFMTKPFSLNELMSRAKRLLPVTPVLV